MMENDWKKRLGVVYSTNPEYGYESDGKEETETLAPGEQKLYVSLDKKNRKGNIPQAIESVLPPGKNQFLTL